jgi:hypothetical protein
MAKRTGQITVTTAGTAVQGSNEYIPEGIYLRALSGNTGKVYFGNNDNGDVDSSTGYELAAGDVVYISCSNLQELWFDAATSGDKFCWCKA